MPKIPKKLKHVKENGGLTLPSEIRTAFDDGDISFSVNITLGSDLDDFNERRMGHIAFGKIVASSFRFPLADFRETMIQPLEFAFDDDVQKEPESGDINKLVVGYIYGYRTNGMVDPTSLVMWADEIDQDTYDAFEWLTQRFPQKNELEDILSAPIFHLDRAIVFPEWRGLGFTLPAVATYLDLVANNTFVFLKPALPNAEAQEKFPKNQIKHEAKLLARYWKRLGFEGHDPKTNMLWTSGWHSPSWLRPSL